MTSLKPSTAGPRGLDVRSDQLIRLFVVIGRIDFEVASRSLGITQEQLQRMTTDLPGIDRDGEKWNLGVEVAQELLDGSSPEELEETFHLVLDSLVGQPEGDAATIWNLVDLGCRDPRLIEPVLRIDASTDEEVGPAAARVHSLGRQLGWTRPEMARRRAEALLAQDRFERCLTLCDGVIQAGDDAEFLRAVEISAMAEARLGNLARALELSRMHPPESHDAIASAVTAALGVGALADMRAFADLHGPGATSEVGWSATFVQAMVQSLSGDGSRSVNGLVQASQAVRYASKASRMLPWTPAALAATAALGHGEPVVATSVLQQALQSGSGGDHGEHSHRLGLAWVAMITGDLDRAAELLVPYSDVANLAPFHQTYLSVLRIGIARRAGDRPTLSSAWNVMRGELPGIAVNLFTLPLIGELSIAGARVGDPTRLDDHMARGRSLLMSLGNPPVWSNPFDWAGVQSAIISERPEALMPYAKALAGNASQSHFARLLANAGQAWLDVLRREVDGDRVTAAVSDLADSGFGWEASRLAGFAATQCSDAATARGLLRLARVADEGRLHSGDIAEGSGGDSLLSEREVAVCHLVLQGLGYREIGEQLYISPRTVEHHVARVRRRLGANTRRELLERLREVLD